MENYSDFCRDFIVDNLPNFDGTEVYICDLALELTNGINCDGTVTFSRQKAKDYICYWWDDAADFSDYENYNFGYRSNPFENPELFMVKMVIEGVSSILSQSNYVSETWNDKILLDKDIINEIIEEIGNKEVEF